ncbi:hypothetical protein HZS_7150 [Henneguya salminicola]|nr:hypothetical protein HZS_7150 [Henneguya salminicola]
MSFSTSKSKTESTSSLLMTQSSDEQCVRRSSSKFDTPCCDYYNKDSNQKVENQQVRCTEITCMYSSHDESTKYQKSIQEEYQINKFETVPKSSEWTKIVNATLDVDRDILLEVDTGDSQCCGLKDVQAVELVIAVQSAIKQRQELIEEWKNKTITLTEQIEKLQNEKHCLEKSNLSKDSELESLARKLHDLHKQYKSLSHESNKLKKELDCLKKEYKTLTEAYNSTVVEYKEIKSKLDEATEVERQLETRLKHQMQKNEKLERNSQKLECELEESRKNIKNLTISLDETTKELLAIKQTLEEYKNIEQKLKNLRVQYKSIKEKYIHIEECLSKAYEDNASLKEITSKLNLIIEGLTSDKNELIVAVQCLNNEKNCLVERNQKLGKDLNSAKHNFTKVQSQLLSVQSEVDCLKIKIEDLENSNKNLHGELHCAQHENRNLKENLQTTIGECTSLSRALSEAQCQLDRQQKTLLKVESRVRHLLQEKQDLENMIGNLQDERNTIEEESNRVNNENISTRNQNNELICSLNKVTIELNESLTEIKHLTSEVEQLRHTVETEREKHEKHITRIQEKIRKKSQEWKEYVTNEIQRLRLKRRADIKKYLELNKDLEIRLQNAEMYSNTIESELNSSINDLKKQLESCKRKLEETIAEAFSEKNDIIDKSNAEQAKLKEYIDKQRLESQWLTAELESKIQNLVQKTLDDEAVINLLNKENAHVKEKVRKLYEEHEKLHNIKRDFKSLIETKHTLECELTNCRSLLALAEETSKNLRDENSELTKRLMTEEETAKSLHTKVVKLKRIIGKKDAQIEVLQNTICQLKEQIVHISEENTTLKFSLQNIEKKQIHLTDKIHHLTKELTDAKRAMVEAGEDKKILSQTIKEIENEIIHLESENATLKNELQLAKENHYLTEKALENSHQVQIELKDRVIKAEAAASKSAHEARNLESKLTKMQEHVIKLETDLRSLSEAYHYNDCQSNKKIEELQSQLSTANEEVSILRQQLEKSERRINRLRQSLRESDKALIGLMGIFDALRETLCQVLSIPYTPISFENLGDSKLNDSHRSKDYGLVLHSYKSEAEIYSKNLIDLKRNENELGCKLVNTKKDFEKLSHIMKELQCEYSTKVEKMYQNLKEKEETIKKLETQLVKVQLEAADADEVTIYSLKEKIEHQQNHIKKLQDEKCILQSEILCLAKKVNELESQTFELAEKLKCIENKNSKLQMKNVNLEGDLEKLTLLLKEARDKEQDQICQYKQMMLANRELMEKIRNLKGELERGNRELDQVKSKRGHQQHSEAKCCIPCRPTSCEKELELEVKILTEKLANSQRAEHEAKCAFAQLEETLCSIKKQLSSAQSEQANLEGWVSHLQQLVSGGYIADSSLPQQLSKAEEESKELEKTVESLKSTVSGLHDEKRHLKNTVDHLTKCNQNLENTITAISKNKEILEKELKTIQKKVDYLTEGVKSNDYDLTACTKDIAHLVKNACSISSALKPFDLIESSDQHNDRRITAGIKTYSPYQKVSSEESLDSISVSVGRKTLSSKSDNKSECCIKSYSKDHFSPEDSNICYDCHYMDLKHSDISDTKTSVSKHSSKKSSKSINKSLGQSKDSIYTDKSSKTFV